VRLTTDSDNFTVGAVVLENLRSRGVSQVKAGDSVDLMEYRFTVNAIKDGVILSLDVSPAPPSPATEGGDTDRPGQDQS
jgi:hypothetical protein